MSTSVLGDEESARPSDAADLVRSRIRKVFQFLDQYHQLRNPIIRQISEQPWTLWLRNLPDSPSVIRPDPQKLEDRFIFKVRRPNLTHCPPPPSELKDWIVSGWDQYGIVPQIRESLNIVEQGTTHTVRFKDDLGREKAFVAWKSKRDAWERAEVSERNALELFEKIYALHGQIEREAEKIELVVGDGVLSWRVEEGGIHHPILLKRIELLFDPEKPEFTLSDTDTAPELYSALFSSSQRIDGKSLQNRIEELGHHSYHPLDPDAGAYLRGVLGSLGGGDVVTDPEAIAAEDDVPRLMRDPIVFMRLRTIGLGTMIRAILADIESTSTFPASLVRIVGGDGVVVEPSDLVDSKLAMPAGEDTEVLFAKEANIEQLAIAKHLERSGAVIVQGPPGTGKTHSIGNIIGHLLAQGKSILVTSHTTKALRVLRDQVHQDLQPLCVSVLDSDARGRQELEISVSKISERLSQNNASELELLAAEREKQRTVVIGELRGLRKRLLSSVNSEYDQIVIGGQSYDPAQAARKVSDGCGLHDWIPTPVEPRVIAPLSTGDLAKLYGTNSLLTSKEETELHFPAPAPGEILSPIEFKETVEGIARHRIQAQKLREDLWTNVSQSIDTKELGRLLELLDKALEFTGSAEPWRLHAINAGIIGTAETEAWKGLIDLVKETRAISSEVANALLRHGPKVPDEFISDSSLATVAEIINHLSAGKNLGFMTFLMNPQWKVLVKNVRVGQDEPRNSEHFEAIAGVILISMKRRDLLARWARQMVPLGAPNTSQLGSEPERICAQFLPRIEDAIAWYSKLLSPAIIGLRGFGFNWEQLLREVPPPIDSIGELRRLEHAVREFLQPVTRARLSRQLVDEFEGRLNNLKSKLSAHSSNHHGVVHGLLEAVRGHNTEAYRRHFTSLAELDAKKTTLADRLKMLGHLEKAAPAWASAIRSRDGRHGGSELPGDVGEAWLWRQLQDELLERQKEQPAELQAKIENLTQRLREITSELIEARAWGKQLSIAAKYRQPLIGWLDTQRRLGARTGNKKRIAELVSQARKLMAASQAAVPVWIMPLVRVYENFDIQRTKFDVVIIDEASQCGLEGLIALYLGKQVVIVGDHEQVSPDGFGMEQAPVDNLIKMTLKGIPNSHLYDGKLSVYDLGRQAFGSAIRLTEHFRCVPEIIQFSNELSYNNEIKPLRESGAGGLEPPVVAYRVEGEREGYINREEAFTIASLVIAMTKHEAYKSKSIGVISLLAENQAIEIDRLLRQNLLPAEYEKRRIICGNAAQFQGDERDVMFLSVVDGPKDSGGPLALRQAGANDMYKKRYNVAASRAKDQLWVVFSLDPSAHLKPGDLRRRLIEHAIDPGALMRKLEEVAPRTESEFERQVLAMLVKRGFAVIPQWPVGKYRIDLVVQGEKARLAVECDGDRYHPIEKIPEDMARQAVLERLGWKFERIRGSEFFLDRDRALQHVFKRLERLGIEPRPESPKSSAPSMVLVEELARMAQGVRAEITPSL